MKISDKFNVSFAGDCIIFENKLHKWFLEVTMINPKEAIENMKAFAEKEISTSYMVFGTWSSSTRFYQNRIWDCEFLLEHIDEVINLIVKHNL